MTRGVAHARFRAIYETPGNGRIINQSGETVGVVEDWRLWVNGREIGEVESLHDAVKKTQEAVDTAT